ncbi:hypothetical protein X777_16900 [Ooceraea biroi]|uniref:ZP domain-containing protein n=1 Tax=Ooceraea biroi TaxID=2015173 RepID=A0A026WTF0_OOCBI|nr:hypothetical protein X777_16900 [Ooceraea biroi]
MRLIAAILVVAFSAAVTGQDLGGHALFVRTPDADAARSRVQRAAAPASPADVMAQNILEWIQGIYQQGARKIRQQSDSNAYLPPFSTQRPPEKPRPFQPATSYPSPSQNDVTGFPVQRPSSLYTPPNAGYPVSGQPSSPPFSTPRPSFPNSQQPSSTYVPQNFGSTSYNPRPSQPSYTNAGSSAFPPLNPETSSTSEGPFPPFTTPTTGETGSASGTTGVETGTGIAEGGTGAGDEELKHPPHIHSLDVICSKTMMTINIEFNRAFDGVIYSKGYYMNPECRYVAQNSGQTKYSFTLSLDSCGTQFINDFEGEAGQAYLENVLVLQNEPGIQEVWDTVRRVRCLWEGNINKALTVNFSVDMLNQEIVTFSGDTATAKLDIQIGRGPFAPAADGLVKIGETMTLVVSVEGDPGFDLQVRDCVARDEASTNMLQLTDERGCILKPKLFGAFQKTNDTGNTGASIIAYAFFQAFKFPDVMDLFIECNIELCKTDCEPCPDANQQIEPGRRRRSVTYSPPFNTSTNPVLLSDPVRIGRGFKVIMLDDLSAASSQILESMEETAIEAMTKVNNVCMSNGGFYMAFSLMLSTLFVAIVSAAVLYIKLQRIRRTKCVDS